MLLLITGLILFLSAHSTVFAAAGWRQRVISRIGEPLWKLLYSLISLLGLILIIFGYGAARQSPDLTLLYAAPIWTRHLALLLMVPVFILLSAAYLPGRIQRVVRHPMLLAVILWAITHLLANGTSADILLFGSFLIWALADLISLSWRQVPVVPGAPYSPWNDLIAIIAGLVIYTAFVLWLHRALIGVPVIT
ncbi:MAG TPA: NnrU family protein [Chromatiaceae bacterium]|jgi:uncharacterized membrane protein|nr:MAG: hypothetical protein N838_21980 [Thiohalocapsa sp. PB-PSB1]QQO52801.1 MAG: NnrU family protein [Thiohalocapsa sp. PB-PSB1]HBG95509.1 NnrU family protein [Chromatiaceae bacterium]HCS91408.1 NnrU family protein [Chromatiaceae bacterium]